ncbi:TPA: hypothetical protein ACFP4A_002064 [Neisseria subflava]
MSKNLFLIKYHDYNHYDDTSKILEQAYLKEDIYEKLEQYLKTKEILEAEDEPDKVSIDYIDEDRIIDVIKTILIPECIKKSEDIDKNIIDDETEDKILSFGSVVNVLKLLIMKRDKYQNNPNILLMVG